MSTKIYNTQTCLILCQSVNVDGGFIHRWQSWIENVDRFDRYTPDKIVSVGRCWITIPAYNTHHINEHINWPFVLLEWALPIHLFRHFCYRMYHLATILFVTDKRTDRWQYHAKLLLLHAAVRSAKTFHGIYGVLAMHFKTSAVITVIYTL